MMRPLLAALLFLASLGLPLSAQGVQQPRSLSTEQIAARVTPATVTILTLDASGDTLELGSGFLVRPTGVIITNWHVMARAARAVVLLASGERYDRVEALDGDSTADLAIIKISGYGLPTVVASSTLPPVGARVVAIGSPFGLSQTVSEGIVSAVRLRSGKQVLQMSAPISPGSSGGPVLNSAGRVVAIATSFMSEGQQVNFAVPVRYAMGLLAGSASPRSLAGYFGSAASSEDQSPETAGSEPVAGSRAAVPTLTPATSPRSDISGSYAVTYVVDDSVPGQNSWRSQFTGLLMLGGRDVGLMVLFPQRGDSVLERNGWVWLVLNAYTTPDGRVLLHTIDPPFEGYQTDAGGLSLSSRALVGDTVRSRRLQAIPARIPLTSPSGIYALEGRSYWTSGDGHKSSTPTDWTGRAVVAVMSDSVYVDLQVRNSASGGSGTSLSGPIQDGRFSLEDADWRLTGRVGNGRLDVDFVDRRDIGSRFEGHLSGNRE